MRKAEIKFIVDNYVRNNKIYVNYKERAIVVAVIYGLIHRRKYTKK